MAAIAARRSRTGSIAWLVALGIVLAALNLRTAVSSVGPVLDQIRDSLGMSAVTAGVLTTLPVLCFAAFGAVTPALSRRAGEHRLLVAALVLTGVGLLVRSMVDDVAVFLLASAVALSGGAIGNVLIPTLIKRHFPARPGPLTTLYSVGLAFGTMISAAATVPIQKAADGDWHVALGVWAALAAVAVIPWLALLRTEPERGAAGGIRPGDLLRNRLAWAMAGYFGSQSLIAYVIFGWFPQFLLDHGFTGEQTGTVMAIFAAVGIPVSLVVPALATRMRDQRPLILGFAAIYVIGFAGLMTGQAIVVWTLVLSLAMGSFPLALALLGLRTRTAEATAALSAFGQSAGYLIAGAGPLVVGLLYQVSGGWTLPFALLFVVVAAQAVTGWYVGGDRVLDDVPDNDSHGPSRIDPGHLSQGRADRIVGSGRAGAAGGRARSDRGPDPVPPTRPRVARPAGRHRPARRSPGGRLPDRCD
ncbi:CynX/NimT family MFS transporter [Herbidospora yilanensis]|uniref:CynX/NimT family MFS transporter n=1 Tax=Herbidospora yilanensis TaxID=354426 RepID=UPI0009FD4828|nr:MFS transporter [Herbidospora yilanensis]